MSPRIPIITSKELIRVARRIGFQFDRQSGSHAIYISQEKKLRIVIPIHKSKDIKPGTLKGIIEDMGITLDKFRELL